MGAGMDERSREAWMRPDFPIRPSQLVWFTTDDQEEERDMQIEKRMAALNWRRKREERQRARGGRVRRL